MPNIEFTDKERYILRMSLAMHMTPEEGHLRPDQNVDDVRRLAKKLGVYDDLLETLIDVGDLPGT